MSMRKLKSHFKYLVPEFRLALIKEPGPKPQRIQTPDCLDALVEPLKHYPDEHFVAFHLSAANEVNGYQIISHGTISSSLVHPREVFKGAILANAYAIIVAHNHPGGSLKPSDEDIETTKSLIAAGRLMGVPVLDHIIVSSNGLTSLRMDQPSIWQ